MSRKSRKQPPYVATYRHTVKTPAWKMLSVGARATLFALTYNYNTNMQNAVYLSARTGAKELNCDKKSVPRWLRELQHYGFIVMVRGSSLGVDGLGRAPHFRLTDRYYAGAPPTYDFQNWTGEIFDPQKHFPVPLMGTPRTADGDISKNRAKPKKGNKCTADGDIATAGGCTADGDITSLASWERSGAGLPAPDDEWQRNSKLPAERLDDPERKMH
jgi:hypothetical protein